MKAYRSLFLSYGYYCNYVVSCLSTAQCSVNFGMFSPDNLLETRNGFEVISK